MGVREDFSKSFKEAMKNSGTTHLVAISGYNITLLAIAIGYICGYFFSRRITFFAATFAILIFVIMVGGEASVGRAAVLGVVPLISPNMGRLH